MNLVVVAGYSDDCSFTGYLPAFMGPCCVIDRVCCRCPLIEDQALFPYSVKLNCDDLKNIYSQFDLAMIHDFIDLCDTTNEIGHNDSVIRRFLTNSGSTCHDH